MARLCWNSGVYVILIASSWNLCQSQGLRCYSCISFEGTAPNEECKNGPLSMKNTVAGFPSSRWVSRGQCCGPPWDQIGDCILNPVECAEGYFTTTTRQSSTTTTTTTTVPDVTTTTTPPRPPNKNVKIFCSTFHGKAGDMEIFERNLLDSTEALDGTCQKRESKIGKVTVRGEFCYCSKDLCNKLTLNEKSLAMDPKQLALNSSLTLISSLSLFIKLLLFF